MKPPLISMLSISKSIVIFAFATLSIFTQPLLAVQKVGLAPNPVEDCKNFLGGLREGSNLQRVSKEADEQLRADWEPSPLVEIEDVLVSRKVIFAREELQRRAPHAPMYRHLFLESAYPYLKQMIKDANLLKYNIANNNKPINIFVHSSYRSYADQCYTFLIKVREYTDLSRKAAKQKNESVSESELERRGQWMAARMSAIPGRTEHQLGTAVDLSTDENLYEIDFTFENTRAFVWLQQNAYKYGFVLSYTAGPSLQENDPYRYNKNTGYNYEPWHWRFIGVELATEFYQAQLQNKDLTIQQFLRRYQQ